MLERQVPVLRVLRQVWQLQLPWRPMGRYRCWRPRRQLPLSLLRPYRMQTPRWWCCCWWRWQHSLHLPPPPTLCQHERSQPVGGIP